MKKLLIIGAGGVGSYLSSALYKYDKYGQLPQLQITLADDDSVDTKNLSYQCFTDSDLLEFKSQALANKYKQLYITRRISFPKDEELLKTFDCIVCSVDSTTFRKEFFKFISENNKYWIDLRSTGKTITALLKHKQNTLPTLLSTLPKITKDAGSCQNTFELENGIIQGGNRIIAEIGAQFILNWYRGEEYANPKEFIHTF